MNLVDAIHELNNRVRELINIPHKHYELRQDAAFFSQLASALDVIGDTEEAITAYEAKQIEESKGAQYLALYGVLQAIYVQQDAVINLSEAVGAQASIHNYPKLAAIREVRNDVAGHPTKRDRRKGLSKSYNHVSRMSLSHSGFTLLTFFSDGSPFTVRHIDMLQLIAEQKAYISAVLTALIGSLEAENKAHKETFRMEKLVDIFPHTLGYNIEKIFEGIFRDDYAEFAALNLEQVDEVIGAFRAAVGRRDMEFYESLEHEYVLVNHCVEYLKNYFSRKNLGSMPEGDTRTAQIFATYLRDRVDSLKGDAKQIDEDFAED